MVRITFDVYVNTDDKDGAFNTVQRALDSAGLTENVCSNVSEV